MNPESHEHCLHESTGFGTPWCCKCEKYDKTYDIATDIGFYETPLRIPVLQTNARE